MFWNDYLAIIDPPPRTPRFLTSFVRGMLRSWNR